MGKTLAFLVCGLGAVTLLSCGGSSHDIRVPTLTASIPVDGATEVAANSVIDLFWEQDLEPASVPTHVSLEAPSGAVPAVLSYDPVLRRIRISPDEVLALGTPYVVLVAPGLSTADGRVLESGYDVSFRVHAGSFEPALLAETQAVDGAMLAALALNESGQGFLFWIQLPSAGNKTLWATAYDTATGLGTATALATASILGMGTREVAINAAGEVMASWITQGGGQEDVWAAFFDAGAGTWSAALKLNVAPGQDARGPTVALDDDGRAIVVWSQDAGFGLPDDLWYRTFSRTSGWGAAALLETTAGDAAGPWIGMNASGQACVAWHQETSTVYDIYARRYDPGTGWSAVEPLEGDDTTRAFAPEVVVAPDGNILVCWRQEEGAPWSDERMWANRFVAGGGPGSGWQGAVLLQDDVGTNDGFVLGIDGSGNATVAWQQDTGTGNSAYARRCLSTGVWEDPVTLSGADTSGIDANSLRIAVNAAGRAVVVWAQGPMIESKDILERTFVPGIGWGPTSVLDPAGLGYTPFPDVALDREGNVLVSWQQDVYEGGTYQRSDAWGQAASMGQGWWGPELLEEDQVGSGYLPLVAIDRFGRGVAAWYQTRGPSGPSDVYVSAFR